MDKNISEEEGLKKAIAKVEKEKKMLKRKYDRIMEKHQLEQDLELSEDEEDEAEAKEVVKVKEETLESLIMSEVKEEVMDAEEEVDDVDEEKDEAEESDLDDKLDKILKKKSVNLWAGLDESDEDDCEEYKGIGSEDKDLKVKVEVKENKEESKVSVVVKSKKKGFKKITIRASRSRTMGQVKRKYMKSMKLVRGSSITFLTPSSIEVADHTAIGLLEGITLTAVIKETKD